MEKQVLLKRLWLTLMEGKILELRGEHEVDGFGIKWYRYDGDSFFIIL